MSKKADGGRKEFQFTIFYYFSLFIIVFFIPVVDSVVLVLFWFCVCSVSVSGSVSVVSVRLCL